MFEIETYKVSSYLARPGNETTLSRVLELTSPPMFHNIRNHASFAFSTSFEHVWNEPVAGYLGILAGGLSIVGWFPLAEYGYYYDILRSEKPVHVLYEFKEGNATAGYLSQLGLGTSFEQVGEGPSDSDHGIAEYLAYMDDLLVVGRRVLPWPTREVLPKRAK
jgi:hypothetical protein